jgi:hypothetical protein
MTAQRVRRTPVWNSLWLLAAGNRSLAVVLLGLTLPLLVPFFLPQLPSEPAAASRWLALAQGRFGSLLAPLSALGLFSIARSPLNRLLLVALAFLLSVRVAAWAEQLWRNRRPAPGMNAWRPLAERGLESAVQLLRRRGYRVRPVPGRDTAHADRWPWAELMTLLADGGALLVLVGLLVTQVWGWRAAHLTGRPGEMVAVPGRGEVELVAMPAGVAVDPSSGVRLYREGTGPELTVTATDAAGEPLGLQQTPEAAASHSLRLRLTEEETDAYFAIPEAGLVVRVALGSTAALDGQVPFLLQIFRSPSGELVRETLVTGGFELVEGDSRVRLARTEYLVLAAVYDPGYWLKVVALVGVALALPLRALWPVRRLRLRNDGGRLAGSGDLPGWLVEAVSGRQRRGQRGRAVLGVGMGLLAPVIAAMALRSLVRSGGLGDQSTVQAGMTALWLGCAAVHLAWTGGAAGPDLAGERGREAGAGAGGRNGE